MTTIFDISQYIDQSTINDSAILLDADIERAQAFAHSVSSDAAVHRSLERMKECEMVAPPKGIFFADDWNFYPRAIVDTTTQNAQWVRQAGLYRSMGIKNHEFLLVLLNPDLQGIDPYGPEALSTPELQRMILMEAIHNPWYAFRECMKAPGRGASRANPIEARRHFVAYIFSYYNHLESDTIAPRQTGKSFAARCVIAAGLGFRSINANYVMLVHTDTLRQETVAEVKNLMDNMPGYLNARSTRKDNNNLENIKVSAYKNQFKILVGQSGAAGAEGIARGATAGNLHYDETAFTPNGDITIPAMGGTAGAYVDSAKEADADYCTSSSTTAGSLLNRVGRWVYDRIQCAYPWSDFLLDTKNQADLHKVVAAGCRKGRVATFIEFNHRELGYTDEYIKGRIILAGGDVEQTNRDFFNHWQAGSRQDVFNAGQIKDLVSGIVPPKYLEIDDASGISMRWWIPKEQIKSYMAQNDVVMSIDTSDAIGKDDVRIYLLDSETAGVIAAAAFNGNLTGYFFEWTYQQMMRYPNMVIIPENRSTGRTLIDYLLQKFAGTGENPFMRIFNTVVNENTGDRSSTAFQEVLRAGKNIHNIAVKYRSSFGYATSGSGEYSRNNLFKLALHDAASSTFGCVRDVVLKDQLMGLEKKNGRIDHAVDGHDDAVVAYSLGQWFLRYGKNLGYYGFDVSRIMRLVVVKTTDKKGKTYTQEEINLQRNLRRGVGMLLRLLEETSGPLEAIRIEGRLNRARRLLRDVGDGAFNMSAMMEAARKVRDERFNKNR